MKTINEVAAYAGVSIATVSNVINKTRIVSPKTEEKVIKAIKELSYVPNYAAKSLKTNSYKTIGVVAEEVASFSTPKIIDGICEVCEQHGYTVNLCNLRTYSHSEYDLELLKSSLSSLQASRACGIIYIGANAGNVSNICKYISLPIVYTYCYADDDKYTVNYNDFAAAREAAEYLIKKGHKRIATITGSIMQEFVHNRILGFKSALADNSLQLPMEYVQAGDWSYDIAYEHAIHMLRLPNPPTAIFAMNDIMACGVIAAAASLNISIPHDLSLIGFDNRSCSMVSTPPLSTLNIPLYDIGQVSAVSLINLLKGDSVERHQLLSCEFIDRKTVSKPLK